MRAWLLLITGLLGCPFVWSAERTDTAKTFTLTWGVKIPTRDGIRLNATLYQPAKKSAPTPTILALTPYTADQTHNDAIYFARSGYTFAVVDCRGRGNSEGRFEPRMQDGPDGYDAAEWLARQPWCNGKVGMWGVSYLGFAQWATLKELPPHLATIVPRAAGYPGICTYDQVNNVFRARAIRWVAYVSGTTGNEQLFADSAFWVENFRELTLHHRAFRELDALTGNPSAIFQTWLAHPNLDDHLAAQAPTVEQFQRMNIPILSITGQYDFANPGALEYYERHQQHGPAEGRARHYLVIGPWDHNGTHRPGREVGGLKFAEASQLDLGALNLNWYHWTLGSAAHPPPFLKKRIAYYVTGAEEWRYADDLASVSHAKLVLNLHAGSGTFNDIAHPGALRDDVPRLSPPDQYTYDPLDLRVPAQEKFEPQLWITNPGHVTNLFGDGLVYESEPQQQPLDIAGRPRFVAAILLDVPDTDFRVRLYEVTKDSRSILLAEDLMRARHRESLQSEKLARPGEINRYEFRTFPFIARRIASGSRLRLVLDCPNSIFWEKNYSGGGVVAAESARDASVAHVKLYHDPEHPSFLELPW